MNEGGPGIRPETLALDALIKATIEQIEEGTGQSVSDRMLFLGNRHASFPILVVQDPILEPVDKLVWMAIRLQAGESGDNVAFPSYASIAKTANVSTKSTISRAVAILRATRWLTLCACLRASSGCFQGNVFSLHDEPLPLIDVIHLDSTYMRFLRESAEHRHARVRAVAQGVLDTIDEDIEAGRNVCIDEHPIERRLKATEVVEKDMPHRYFAFSTQVIADLRNHTENKNGLDHQGQNLALVEKGVQNLHPQNLNRVNGSSSFINKTTTTKNRERKNFGRCGERNAPLIYPRRLSDNQRELADRYLSTVPSDQRQVILDELEGRIRSERRGMQPLYDELSFLHALCNALKNGEFKFNLGIRVLEDRHAREQALQKSRQAHTDQQAGKGLQLLRNQIKAGKGPIAEIRKSLGVRSPSKKDLDSDTT